MGKITHQSVDSDMRRYQNVKTGLEDVQSSLADIVTVNVKFYGAKGDGVTNDKTAIQNAINYVASVGGGVVLIPNGTFMANSLEVKSGVTIRGNGYNSQIKSNLINSQTFINRTAYSDICLENFRITGFGSENASNGDNDICIDIWNATRLKIKNMFLENGRGHGVYIRGCDTVHISEIFCKNFHEQGVAATTGTNIIIENIVGDFSGAALNSQCLVDIEPNTGDTISNVIIKNVFMKTDGLQGLNLYCWANSSIDHITVSDIYTDLLVVNGVTNGLFSNIFVKGKTATSSREAFSIYSCTDVIFNNIRITEPNIIATKLKLSNNERVIINGISIEGSNENTVIAVDILASNHSKIKNMHIENAGGQGVRLRNTDSFDFNGLEIEGAINYAVYMVPTTSNNSTFIRGFHAYNSGTGVYLDQTNNFVYIDGDVSGCTTPITIAGTNVGTVSFGILHGYHNYRYGTQTVSSGATSTTIQHGLGRIPANVSITPQSTSVGSYFISSVNATQFVVNFGTVPAATEYLMWRVEG